MPDARWLGDAGAGAVRQAPLSAFPVTSQWSSSDSTDLTPGWASYVRGGRYEQMRVAMLAANRRSG